MTLGKVGRNRPPPYGPVTHYGQWPLSIWTLIPEKSFPTWHSVRPRWPAILRCPIPVSNAITYLCLNSSVNLVWSQIQGKVWQASAGRSVKSHTKHMWPHQQTRTCRFPRVESVKSLRLPWSSAPQMRNGSSMQKASCLMDGGQTTDKLTVQWHRMWQVSSRQTGIARTGPMMPDPRCWPVYPMFSQTTW